MIAAGIGGVEAGSEYVVLEEAFFVRLAPSPLPERLFPGRKRASKVKQHCEGGPRDGGDVDPQQRRPDEHEQAAEHDEEHVGDVHRRDGARQHAPCHRVALVSK